MLVSYQTIPTMHDQVCLLSKIQLFIEEDKGKEHPLEFHTTLKKVTCTIHIWLGTSVMNEVRFLVKELQMLGDQKLCLYPGSLKLSDVFFLSSSSAVHCNLKKMCVIVRLLFP